VGTAPGGFAVTLDGRTPKTPGHKPVIVPHADLAALMAAEWAAQTTHVNPETMPVTRLINSAVEAGDQRVAALAAEILKFAGNDLLLYRADAPRELVAAQEAVWDEALVRLARTYDIRFQPTIGIVHQSQPEATLMRLGTVLADVTLFEAVALTSLTGITGSGLLSIGYRAGLFTPDEMWTAAHVDEDFNFRLWGEVEEATERRLKRRRDYDAAVAVLRVLGVGQAGTA
jgi:chaperone required for assembly of F1-ATPase